MTQYFIKSGAVTEEVVIGKEIGAGAVGTIFNVRSPIALSDCAAKIYQDPATFDVDKIQALIADAPAKIWFESRSGSRYPQFAWPQYVLYSPNRFSKSLEPAGFLMPKVEQQSAVTLDAYFDQKLGEKKGLDPESLSLPRRLDVAINLCALLAELHSKHIYCIDFKPQNILAHRTNGLVTFLDCDSYSVVAKNGNRHPATQFSLGYVAPEALKQKSHPSDLGEAQDCFALAVSLFQILNHGIYPYSGIIKDGWSHADNDDDRVKSGYYPYGIKLHPAIAPLPQSVHDLLPLPVRELFDQAFIEGRQRPTAKQWHSALVDLKETANFRRCSVHPGNPEHIHLDGSPCGKCERDRRIKVQKELRANTRPVDIKIDLQPTPVPSFTPVQVPTPVASGPGFGGYLLRFVGILFAGGVLINIFSNKGTPDSRPSTPARPSATAPSAIGNPIVPAAGGESRSPFMPEEILYCLKASNRIETIRSALKAQYVNEGALLQHDIDHYNLRCINYRYYPDDLKRVEAYFALNKDGFTSEAMREVPGLIASAQNSWQPSQPTSSPSQPTYAPRYAERSPTVGVTPNTSESSPVKRAKPERRQTARSDTYHESPSAQHANTPYKPRMDFMSSIEGGDRKAVEYYLNNGISPNMLLQNGAMPLKTAVVKSNTAIAEYLISRDADVNARDASGRTVLSWAMLMGNQSMISMLRRHGATE